MLRSFGHLVEHCVTSSNNVGFNNVGSVWPGLKAYGLGETSIVLLRNYLSTRIQSVKIGDTFSECRELVRRGVPQGSVLGPVFLNVHINDLFYHIKRANLNAYADDEQL